MAGLFFQAIRQEEARKMGLVIQFEASEEDVEDMMNQVSISIKKISPSLSPTLQASLMYVIKARPVAPESFSILAYCSDLTGKKDCGLCIRA
jgi:hypothetical protein